MIDYVENCGCNMPLHYNSDEVKQFVLGQIAAKGSTVLVAVVDGLGEAVMVIEKGGPSLLAQMDDNGIVDREFDGLALQTMVRVPRHYIACHGINGATLAATAKQYDWEVIHA